MNGTCPNCGSVDFIITEVRIMEGKFSSPERWYNFHNKIPEKSKIEKIVCRECKRELTVDEIKFPCEACKDKGWVLSRLSDTDNYEFKKCDDCGKLKTDKEANEAAAAYLTKKGIV